MDRKDNQFEEWLNGNGEDRPITASERDPVSETSTESLAEFDARSNSLRFMPTAQAYGELQSAFTFFNERLFDGKLPNCLITYTRSPNVLGHFCAEAFRDSASEIAHEIALNPMWFAARSIEETLSTLGHEMKHLERHLDPRTNRKGGKGQNGYHDAIWADLMEGIGLKPFDIGNPTKRTGFRVSHRIVEGGPFEFACREFLDRGGMISWRHSWQFQRPAGGGKGIVPVGPDGMAGTQPPKKSRARFDCDGCDQKAWAKTSAVLSCGICTRRMMAR